MRSPFMIIFVLALCLAAGAVVSVAWPDARSVTQKLALGR